MSLSRDPARATAALPDSPLKQDILKMARAADVAAREVEVSREPSGLAEFMIQDPDTGRLHPTALDVRLFYDHPSDADRVAHAMQWRAAHPKID